MLGMVLNQLDTRDLRRHAIYSQKYYNRYYAADQAESVALDHPDELPPAALN
jgi:hypothetical protein